MTVLKKLIQEKNLYILLAIGFMIFAMLSRLLPHPPNFTPIAAVAIFCGAILPRRLAVILPLVAMIVSDLIIGLHPLILFTWGSFAAIALISNGYLHKMNLKKLVGTGLGAALIFYLVTNFGVWLQGQMYPMTFIGLADCYYKALPFFRNTLMGDMIYLTIFFGIYVYLGKLIALSRKSRLEAIDRKL